MSPHHPEIETFLLHKHVGPDETVVASAAPSIESVLVEIQEQLAPE